MLFLQHLLLHLLLLVGLSTPSVGLLPLLLLVVFLDLLVNISLQFARALGSQLVKLKFNCFVVFVLVDASLNNGEDTVFLFIG